MNHDLHSRFEKYALILGCLYCVAVIIWGVLHGT